MKISGFVNKYNLVKFEYYREGNFYFSVWYIDENERENEGCYLFPVPIDDIGQATINCEDKSVFFMRWIRKAIDDKTIIRYGHEAN